jgi:hypothetical protein
MTCPTITIAGLAWHAHSPSLFQQVGYPVTIAFDGRSWLVAVRGVYGLREFGTRQEAAELIASAFNSARENLA